MARPRNLIPRAKALYAPATEEEHRLVLAAAGVRGLPLGEFVRECALREARRVLRKFSKDGGDVLPR